MKCVLCAREMDRITTAFQSKWGEYKVTIEGLEAHQCKQCQRVVFEPLVARMIQNITAGFSEVAPSERPEMINVDDVADLLGVSNQTVYNMIRDGRLKATKVGREWRFLRSQIEKTFNKKEENIPFFLAARSSGELTEKDQAIVRKHLNLSSREGKNGG